jgi:pimeloyl-ACP methyl ester carboxylesterase
MPSDFRGFLRQALKVVLRAGIIFVAAICVVLAVFYALALRRETKTPREIAPPSGRFVQTQDAQVYLQEAGPATGPAVVLIHGTGAWSEIWRSTMSALGIAGFHAIAIDVPPFGYSDRLNGVSAYAPSRQAARILGVLDALHIARATFVAHSVGARPTVELCLENPERVANLVLVDPALGFSSKPADSDKMAPDPASLGTRTFFAMRPMRNAVIATFGTNPAFTRQLFQSFVSKKESVTPERVEMLNRPLAVKGTTAAWGDWLNELLAPEDSSKINDFRNLQNLSMPTFIIWGDSDTVTPTWQAGELTRLIPHSSLTWIAGAGHIPYVESPVQFNNALLQTLSHK